MSKIQIINDALQLVNQPRIETEADLSNASKIILSVYEPAKSYLLSIENFSFSMFTETLATPTGVTVLPTYDLVKTKPAGTLNIVRLLDSYGHIPNYTILGQNIHIKGNDTYTCVFTKSVSEDLMTQVFKTAFSYYLAYRICGNIHESESMRQALMQEFKMYFDNAVDVDAVNTRQYVPSLNNNFYSSVYDNWFGADEDMDRWGYPLNG